MSFAGSLNSALKVRGLPSQRMERSRSDDTLPRMSRSVGSERSLK